jgi:uncharacterized membrane protein
MPRVCRGIAVIWSAVSLLLVPAAAAAVSTLGAPDETFKARVVLIQVEEERIIPGTNTSAPYQELRAEIVSGPREGEIVDIVNDYTHLRKGDTFFARAMSDSEGGAIYGVIGIERRPVLAFLVLIFLGMIAYFGRGQGLRSVASLAASLLIILYVLLPALAAGWPPLLTSALIATIVLSIAIFSTHGWNRDSVAAFLGTSLAVLATILFSKFAVMATHLTGIYGEEAMYLNFQTEGRLDITGLLMGAIVIGVLGILDDVAVTQASVVRELQHAAPHLSARHLYDKAIAVGREHVGALVNTLALAYAGAALPYLLLFVVARGSATLAFNDEAFATEIVRTLAGSIGLILAVPLTTFLAVVFTKRNLLPGKHHQQADA